MSTIYKIQKDVAGYNGFGLPFTDQKYNVTLSATTDTTVAVPLTGGIGVPAATTNCRYLAVVQCTGDAAVWCANNIAADVPAGATFALTSSDLIIGNEYFARECKSGDVLHFYTAATGVVVWVGFYVLQSS